MAEDPIISVKKAKCDFFDFEGNEALSLTLTHSSPKVALGNANFFSAWFGSWPAFARYTHTHTRTYD